MRLRRNWFNQTRGLRDQHVNVHHVNNTDKVIAFHRWETGGPCDDVVIVANFGNRGYGNYTLGFPRAGNWRVRLYSGWQGYSPDFGNQLSYDTSADGGTRDEMPFQANVRIGPYSVLICQSIDRLGIFSATRNPNESSNTPAKPLRQFQFDLPW